MDLEAFLTYVRKACRDAGVSVVISDGPRVFYEGMACNGFFESTYPVQTGIARVLSGGPALVSVEDRGPLSPLLAAARGGKSPQEFLGLLAHEYCHMRQFVEGSPVWVAGDEFLVWEAWLRGDDVSAEELLQVWRRVVAVEADCEARVLAMLAELDLPLDRALYAQRANSYLFFYTWALRNRSFYNKAPYEVADIVQRMPTALLPVQEYLQSSTADQFAPLFDQCA